MKTLIAVQFPILREGIKKILSEEANISVNDIVHQRDELFSLTSDSDCILILDLNFSEENKKSLVGKLLQKFPCVDILALGDDEKRDDIRGVMQTGASGYICRKQSIDELTRAIKKIGQGGIYLSDETIGMLYNRSRSESKSNLVPAELTERESQILSQICKELTNREIADKLSISVRTVDTHRMNLLQKTGAKNTAGLVKYAIKHKIYKLL